MRNFLLFICVSIIACGQVHAHEAGITDSGITILRDSVRLLYTVPVDHLDEFKIPPGADSGGATLSALMDAVLDGFVIKNNGQTCQLATAKSRRLSAIKSQQFDYALDCGGPVKKLEINYNLLFDQDSSHENFARISLLRNTQNVTFSTANRTYTIDVEALVLDLAKQRNTVETPVAERPGLASGAHYFPVGVEHILLGFDHLLFLAALLLLPLRFRHVLVLITSFTLAHSVTLALSVLDIVSIPSYIVELTIAFSIVYVALETLVAIRGRSAVGYFSQRFIRNRLIVTTLFGLVHGFGFSFILKQIGLGEQLLVSLLFFNLGVEFGQIVAMLLFFPVVWFLFKRFPNTLWAQICAGGISLFGIYWFLQRLPELSW